VHNEKINEIKNTLDGTKLTFFLQTCWSAKKKLFLRLKPIIMNYNKPLNMLKSILLWACVCLSNLLVAQPNPEPYKIFTDKGRPASYSDMLKDARNADVVFFGELHNSAIAHWLQLEMAQDLFARHQDKLVMGGEIFEADNQIVINEYFLDYISEKSFESESRVWSNYATDYRPLINFAKTHELRFVATNVPRRYASMVARKGLEELDELPGYSKIYLPPLPIKQDMNVGCYSRMLEMGDGNEKFPQAQMLKDATMAQNIFKNLQPKDVFFHINGAFHSDYGEGIIWYLRYLNPDLKIVVISTVEQENVDKLSPDHYKRGDYIIAVPAKMTKTH
jgi:uncharacterized iron-regulated protein